MAEYVAIIKIMAIHAKIQCENTAFLRRINELLDVPKFMGYIDS